MKTPQALRKSVLVLGYMTLLFGLGFLLIGCNQNGHAVSLGVPDAITPTYEAQIESPTPFIYYTPTPENDLPAPEVRKARAEAAATASRVAQLTHVPTWPPGVPREYPTAAPSTPSYPVPTRIAGLGAIYDSGNTSVPVAIALVWNRWVATVNRQVINVYAGSKSDLRYQDQGIVVVVIEDANRHILSGPDTYETPLRVGAVKVVDAVGQQLTLRAEDGTHFSFDVSTRQWIPLPPPPSATVTPP